MAATTTSKKSGGAKKIGRNKEKAKRYSAMHTREKRKVRHVLHSNGLEAAKKYAAAHNMTGYLGTLIKS